MRILWVGTKSPLPPADGGRLVALATVRALAAAGHEVTVVAPGMPGARGPDPADFALELVPARPRPWPLAAAVGLARGWPVTIARHAHAAVTARVDALLAARPFDVVHAEQVQAFSSCRPALTRGVPVVLRAQNVESDLWNAARSFLRRAEARRLARFESAAVGAAAATIALSARDAARLAALAGDATRVRHVRAPFPADGLGAGRPLAGAPAVVAPGSAGWPPNDEAVAWLARAVWPLVAARLPAARLHVFGAPSAIAAGPAISVHPPPAESADVFPAGAIVVVPLLTAVGVRIRILEAWARGLPVVATPAAVAGLDAEATNAVAIARSAGEIADAIVTLAGDADRRQAMIAAGATVLRARHDPATIAAELAAVYRSAAGASPRAEAGQATDANATTAARARS